MFIILEIDTILTDRSLQMCRVLVICAQKLLPRVDKASVWEAVIFEWKIENVERRVSLWNMQDQYQSSVLVPEILGDSRGVRETL